MWLSKRSWDGNSTWVYPEVCHFARKDVSYRGKKVGLQKLDMKEAQWLIKQWPRVKDSECFYKIEHLNLIAKKFGFMNIAEKILQGQRKAVIQ